MSKFYEHITESVWTDMQKRSIGNEKRLEDVVHLDDNTKDRFKFCLKRFVNFIVYCEKFDNTIDDLKQFIEKDGVIKTYTLWKNNTTIHFADVVLPYVDDNWNQVDNIQKQINELVKKEETEIRKLGFRKEPGKTIEDTLCEWWDSLDDDKKYDIIMGWCEDDIMSRFYENHRDDDEFTGEDVDVDDEWDRVDYLKQVRIYVEESKTNESVWTDMQKRSSGDEIRKEDCNLTLLNHYAKMFKNAVDVCSDPRNPVTLHYDDTCDDFVKYLDRRRGEHLDKIGSKLISDKTYLNMMKYVKNYWGDCKGIQEFIDKYLGGLNECEGVPGCITPANVGGMGAAYFPEPNGEPGSGDLPSPTGVVYHQVAPFGVFIKELKKKKKKKKFRKEDEPCSHSPNAKVYDYVDDYREYVDRTYTMMNRKK